MRRLVSLALAALLVLSSVATVDAATVKRTWTARVGKDAVNGTARMLRYPAAALNMPVWAGFAHACSGRATWLYERSPGLRSWRNW